MATKLMYTLLRERPRSDGSLLQFWEINRPEGSAIGPGLSYMITRTPRTAIIRSSHVAWTRQLPEAEKAWADALRAPDDDY